MKKSNSQITTAQTAAGNDLQKTAARLGVSVRWLRAVKARRNL